MRLFEWVTNIKTAVKFIWKVKIKLHQFLEGEKKKLDLPEMNLNSKVI